MRRRTRRRRRKPSGRDQAPVFPSPPPRSYDGPYDSWDALRAAQPAWVFRIWHDPQRRAVFAVGWLVLAVAILVAAFSDPPVDFTGRARGVLWAAIALVALFGTVLVQALQDLRRKENRVPVFFALDRFLRTRLGAVAFAGYLLVVIAAYVALPG